ncbi:MAG TPA: hypothetical protein VMV49_02635 [Candidatus Deferrimicrobium sp.]|nr:hypothetical protein [Candidatus Deferrimicrobium sp.]
MKNKLNKIIFPLFFILVFSNFLIPIMADPTYGVKDNSEYIWDVTEQSVMYKLTGKFNMRQKTVDITQYFYENGSSHHSNIQMTQFRKFIVASHEKIGQHKYFYTGQGCLNFPRSVVILTDAESTQIIESTTGIIINYTSTLEQHVLISGPIPISWVVWIILGITIGLSCFSIFFIYKKGKKQYPALIYSEINS